MTCVAQGNGAHGHREKKPRMLSNPFACRQRSERCDTQSHADQITIAPFFSQIRTVRSSYRAWPALAIATAFLAYAVTLMTMEWVHGQEAVRPFFADVVQGPPFLFAVNTTLASGLQGIASVFFAVAWHVGRLRQAGPAFLRLAAVNTAFFAWTAADDRFLLHERLPNTLEALYWVVLGATYVAMLMRYRAALRGRGLAVAYLVLGGVLFAGMLVADQWMPEAARLRLSLEDLLKAAASLSLAAFAWHHLRAELDALVAEQPVRTSAP